MQPLACVAMQSKSMATIQNTQPLRRATLTIANASLSKERPMSERLAGRLAEWSTNCLIDGLRMDRGEPTLQELLCDAASRLAPETPAFGQEPWRVSLPVITVQMLGDYGQEGFFEKTNQPVKGVAGVSWSQAAVDFACMLQGLRQKRGAQETNPQPNEFLDLWQALCDDINANPCRWPGLRNELQDWLRAKGRAPSKACAHLPGQAEWCPKCNPPAQVAPLCSCGHDGPPGPGHQTNCPQWRAERSHG